MKVIDLYSEAINLNDFDFLCLCILLSNRLEKIYKDKGVKI